MKKYLFIRHIEIYKGIFEMQVMFFAAIRRLDIAKRILKEPEAWAEERAAYWTLKRVDRRDRKRLKEILEKL